MHRRRRRRSTPFHQARALAIGDVSLMIRSIQTLSIFYSPTYVCAAWRQPMLSGRHRSGWCHAEEQHPKRGVGAELPRRVYSDRSRRRSSPEVFTGSLAHLAGRRYGLHMSALLQSAGALPDRGVTLHSGHIGNTFRPLRERRKCRGRSVARWMSACDLWLAC